MLDGNLEFQWKLRNKSKTVNINGTLPKYPVLILTCMDSRINIYEIFQLNLGDVLILRNAGNVYSKDIMRSILLAIFEFKINHIIILGHLDCQMTKVNISNLKHELAPSLVRQLYDRDETPEEGIKRFFKIFDDEIRMVNNQIKLLRKFPDFPKGIEIMGMLYDVNSGWIFDSKDFEHLESKEEFLINFKKLLRKKYKKLTKFVKCLKTEKQELKLLKNTAPLEKKVKQNHFANHLENESKSFKILPKSFTAKNYVINGINPIKLFSNKKSSCAPRNLRIKIIVPKYSIPKLNFLNPNINLKNEG